jgi:two-component system, chemotaxis family, protein-glutamate methylesterase/glutaminase
MDTGRIFLLPGEMAVKKQPFELATLLGSCVAVCLFNTQGRFGGMNHFLLPHGSDEVSDPGKYGYPSTERLLDLMLRADANARHLQAKIYGGGAVVGHLAAGTAIGEKNILAAHTVLGAHDIPIVDKDIGGSHGRKIFFKNWTGEVEVRQIQKSQFAQDLEAKSQNLKGRKIRVLIVDDSATVRSLLKKGIEQDPELEVVGTAQDAYEARDKFLELDPDVITLDIIMPKLDGVSFLKKIMVYKPKPVIVVSTIAQRGSEMRRRADEVGAAAVIDKEELKIYQGMDKVRQMLCTRIKTVASLPVKKRTAEEVKDI